MLGKVTDLVELAELPRALMAVTLGTSRAQREFAAVRGRISETWPCRTRRKTAHAPTAPECWPPPRPAQDERFYSEECREAEGRRSTPRAQAQAVVWGR